MEVKQDYPKYFTLYGRIYTITKNLSKAIHTLSIALQYESNSDNFFYFGIALYLNEQYEQAQVAFQLSQQQNNNVKTMLFIASCYIQLKCFVLAFSWVNRSLKLSPSNICGLFLKQLLLSNCFSANIKEIIAIRKKILNKQRSFVVGTNIYCQQLTFYNEDIFSFVRDIDMECLASKYYPIEFNEPQQLCNEIKMEKENQYYHYAENSWKSQIEKDLGFFEEINGIEIEKQKLLHQQAEKEWKRSMLQGYVFSSSSSLE